MTLVVLSPSRQCSFYWNISNSRLCVWENDMVACANFLASSLKFFFSSSFFWTEFSPPPSRSFVFCGIFFSSVSFFFRTVTLFPSIHFSANTSLSLSRPVRRAASVSPLRVQFPRGCRTTAVLLQTKKNKTKQQRALVPYSTPELCLRGQVSQLCARGHLENLTRRRSLWQCFEERGPPAAGTLKYP